MWEALRFIKDSCGWSVEVKNLADDRIYWVDVWLDEAHKDVEADWNQYIFHTDNSEDMIRKETQDNCDNFIDATGSAICFLEGEGQIAQDDKANWYSCCRAAVEEGN